MAAHDSTRLCDDCKSIVQSVRPKSGVVQTAQLPIGQQHYQEALAEHEPAPISFFVEEGPRAQAIPPESFDLNTEAAQFRDSFAAPAPQPEGPPEFGSNNGGNSGGNLDTNPLEPDAQAADLGSRLSVPKFDKPHSAIGREAPTDDGASLDSLRASVDPQPTQVSPPPPPPAQPWPTKQNSTDWPLVIAPRVQKQSRMKMLLLIPLIAALGAGAYFGWKWLSERQTSKAAVAVGNQNSAPAPAAAQKQPAASGQAAAPQSGVATTAETAKGEVAKAEAAKAEAAKAEAAKKEQPAPPPATDAGQGRFSLQAASFPNQAGANEFSEKLIRAGVPAHVSAADLGAKGKWYRVKVGRFNTAEDANKFATEARLRAKSAGITLQLIPSDY